MRGGCRTDEYCRGPCGRDTRLPHADTTGCAPATEAMKASNELTTYRSVRFLSADHDEGRVPDRAVLEMCLCAGQSIVVEVPVTKQIHISKPTTGWA